MSQNRKVQYLAAFAVSLATMTTATSYFWAAPVLPKFFNNETSISITTSEMSWVVASISPGAVVGSLISSRVSDKFGRRATLLASASPFIIGTVIVLCATKVWMLYISRFLWGCGNGMIATVSSIYLSEIADKEIRGTLTAVTRFMFGFGSLLVMVIGPFVTYRVISSILIVLPVCYFIACWRIPESPYYLLKEGKVDAARKELTNLSGYKDDKILEEKLTLMRSDVIREMHRSGSVKELLTGKQYRKAVIVTVGLRITQIMAGSIPINQYLGRILQKSNSSMMLSTAMIIFGVVRFIVGLVAPVLIDKVGRRPLFMYSFLGCCVMLTTVGTYYFLQRIFGIDNESLQSFSFIVITGIIIILIISNMGYDTLIFIIPSELFPLNVRSIAMTVFNIFTAVLTFTVVKGHQIIEDFIGLYAVFWFYATMAFSGAVFTYFVVPETRGKTLREIQIELQGNIYDEAVENLKQVDVISENQNTELKDMGNKNSNL